MLTVMTVINVTLSIFVLMAIFQVDLVYQVPECLPSGLELRMIEMVVATGSI